MFVTADNKLGFIHIPKSGGTSVIDSFNGNVISVCSTHSAYSEYTGNEPEVWFATVRHPAARIHSAFYYQLEWDQKRISGELGMKAGLTLDFLKERVRLFKDYGFVNSILDQEVKIKYNDIKRKHNIKVNSFLENLQSSCYFINGCKNIKTFDIDTNATELFYWLKSIVTDIEYTHSRKNKNKKFWQDECTPELLDFVKNNYSDDLERFGYKV